MKPQDFGVSMLDQAHRLRHSALARSSTTQLDERSACWLVPVEHRARLLREMDAMMLGYSLPTLTRRTELLGLPVRFTLDDDPSTPELQLVMEPVLLRQPSRGR